MPPGRWTKIDLPERARNERQNALVSAAMGLFFAIALSTFGLFVVKLAIGSDVARERSGLWVRGVGLILFIGLPVGAQAIWMTRKGTLALLDATRGTSWRWESDRGGLSVFAITRDGTVRWIEGEAHFRVGEDVSGAEVSTGELFRLGLRDLARALDEDPRDLLVLAAFAGMIARSEIRIGRTLRRKWAHDKPTEEVPGWDARAVAPLAIDQPIERAIMSVLAPPAPASDPVVDPYRASLPVPAAPQLELVATPLKDAWSAAWAAAGPFRDDDRTRSEGDEDRYFALRDRLRAWLAREAELRAFFTELSGGGPRPA